MSFGVNASCDVASAQAEQARSPAEHPNLVLATTVLASGLAFVDGSVVNVGLPTIEASFHVGSADLQWVINAYLLPASALLLFGGGAGDRFGRRRILILGMLLFAASSLLCALAPTLSWLLIGRVLQGTGAALLLPNSLAILGESFSDEARGRAIGIWAAAGAIMGAVGPVLGGWLIDLTGWRAIFLINLPLALAAIALALAYIRVPRTDSGKGALDVAGSMLAALVSASLLFPGAFTGRMGSVSMFSKVLTQQQIAVLFARGSDFCIEALARCVPNLYLQYCLRLTSLQLFQQRRLSALAQVIGHAHLVALFGLHRFD